MAAGVGGALLAKLSGLPFLGGGLVALAVSARFEPSILLPFAAGNFV